MIDSLAWRDPPVREVIFEVRFPPLKDYALFVGGMAAANKEKFPTSENLLNTDIPLSIIPEGQAIHRFFNQQRTLLFQTGRDVLSVNAISYRGFSFFLADIQEILNSAKEYIDNNEVNLFYLRYVNIFQSVNNPFEILNIKSPFENHEISRATRIQISYVKQNDKDESKNIATNLAFPVNVSDLLLDLSVASNHLNLSWDINKILEWISQAHEVIYQSFEELVSDSEKQKRK